MPADTEHIISFSGIRLNTTTKSVYIGKRLLTLSPTSFALLHELLARAPNVISVNELLDTVWHGKVVNRDAVKQQVKALREQFGERAEIIESVRGFGYRIKPDIPTEPHEPIDKPEKDWYRLHQPKIAGISFVCLLLVSFVFFNPTPFGKKASIQLPLITAVLPFSHDNHQETDLSLFLQDELTSMLSKQAQIRTISVSGVRDAIANDFAVEDYADKLKVDMLFEGSIRKSAKGYHVNVRMVLTKNSIAAWRDNINIEASNREKLLTEVTDAVEAFIVKKVAYLEQKGR